MNYFKLHPVDSKDISCNQLFFFNEFIPEGEDYFGDAFSVLFHFINIWVGFLWDLLSQTFYFIKWKPGLEVAFSVAKSSPMFIRFHLAFLLSSSKYRIRLKKVPIRWFVHVYIHISTTYLPVKDINSCFVVVVWKLWETSRLRANRPSSCADSVRGSLVFCLFVGFVSVHVLAPQWEPSWFLVCLFYFLIGRPRLPVDLRRPSLRPEPACHIGGTGGGGGGGGTDGRVTPCFRYQRDSL